MRTCSFLFTSRSTYTTSCAAEVMHHRLKVEFGVVFFFYFIFALILLRQIPICLDKVLSAVTLL